MTPPDELDRASIPCAGEVFTVVYPFVISTFLDVLGEYENGAPVERPTWKPGVDYREIGPEDSEAFCDAEGQARFTVVDVFKPGHYPARVFYTRKFVDPVGKEFGKSKLHIATLDKFRRLTLGYRNPYGIGAAPCPYRPYRPYRLTRETFEQLLQEARQ